MRRTTIAIALVVALAGCAGMLPGGTPHDATAVFRPADMVIDRAEAVPGEIVEISFPQAMERGLMYVLEEHTGSSWTYRYMLVSDASGGQPSWHRAEADVAVESIGIAGPGPDRLVIPEPAAVGDYRICTGNAVENVCVEIAIRAP